MHDATLEVHTALVVMCALGVPCGLSALIIDSGSSRVKRIRTPTAYSSLMKALVLSSWVVQRLVELWSSAHRGANKNGVTRYDAASMVSSQMLQRSIDICGRLSGVLFVVCEVCPPPLVSSRQQRSDYFQYVFIHRQLHTADDVLSRRIYYVSMLVTLPVTLAGFTSIWW